MSKLIDLITIGRASVDLYGSQVGGRLEDMASFSKYIGGSPTNIAAGAARLGLKAALITRVGDEHFGRFIREELMREGVDVRCVTTDPERLTALAVLGIRDDENFPLIFFRENCADMALSEADISEAFIAEAHCVCATGTHLSNPRTENAVLKALKLARRHGARTALDIDYRPNLWGLAGHGQGESRYIGSGLVTEKLQSTLHYFDLIVGTEEEFHIAGGSTDTLLALSNVRSATGAALVCKRGPLGAVVFQDAVPDDISDGLTGPGFEVEVFNVLGAGDGFMAGLLFGWLNDQDWSDALKIANACGALAVSRHGCAPSYPTKAELEFFLQRGVRTRSLRKDTALEQTHWATTRTPRWPSLKIMDCRSIHKANSAAESSEISEPFTAEFLRICLKAVAAETKHTDGMGIALDAQTGKSALYEAADHNLWIGRSAAKLMPRQLTTAGAHGHEFGELSEWPLGHTVHAEFLTGSSVMEPQRLVQIDLLSRLFKAVRRNRLKLLLEVKQIGTESCDSAAMIHKLYACGIFPDWWAIEPGHAAASWNEISAALNRHDPHCGGIILSGFRLHAKEGDQVLAAAAKLEEIIGFMTDPDLIVSTAQNWFMGGIDENAASNALRQSFHSLSDRFDDFIARHRPPP